MVAGKGIVINATIVARIPRCCGLIGRLSMLSNPVESWRRWKSIKQELAQPEGEFSEESRLARHAN